MLAGEAAAQTAEALMRSRYTAYALGDAAHLRRTWHPDHRPVEVPLDRSVTWLGLEILEVEGGRPLDAAGVVAFAARYDPGSGPAVMRERSRFGRVDGAWVYIDGVPLL